MSFNSPNRRSFLQRCLVFFAGLTATPLFSRNEAAPSRLLRDVPSVLSDAPKPVISSEPFIGEIMLFAGDFAPRSWAFCHGQLLPIAQNTALFALLGTTYGGNGTTTFALPDLRGRMAVGGNNATVQLGQQGGTQATTLVAANIAPLSITLDKAQIRTAGTQGSGLSEGGTLAGTPNAVPTNGTATPMSNMPPYLAMNYVICLFGIFPSRN
jgi:microcystin-dependent protein